MNLNTGKHEILSGTSLFAASEPGGGENLTTDASTARIDVCDSPQEKAAS